jgi:hypothetical protein
MNKQKSVHELKQFNKFINVFIINLTRGKLKFLLLDFSLGLQSTIE